MSAGPDDGIDFLLELQDLVGKHAEPAWKRRFDERFNRFLKGGGTVSLDRAFGVPKSWASRARRRRRDAAILLFARTYYATEDAGPAARAVVDEIRTFIDDRARSKDGRGRGGGDRDQRLAEIAMLGGGLVHGRTIRNILIGSPAAREKNAANEFQGCSLHDQAVQLIQAKRSGT